MDREISISVEVRDADEFPINTGTRRVRENKHDVWFVTRLGHITIRSIGFSEGSYELKSIDSRFNILTAMENRFGKNKELS